MSNKEVKIIIISIVIGMIIGCLWQKSYFEKNRPIVSDRKDLCEELGGKYEYFWYDSWNEYVEQCRIISSYIELDQ